MVSKRSREHKWAAATYVPLSEKLVIHGIRRGTVRVPAELKVDVLEVICAACRQAYDDVKDTACTAAEDKDHLIGGPTGERRKDTDAAVAQ